MNTTPAPSRSERFKNIALGVAGIITSIAIPGVGLWLGFIQKDKEVRISATQKDRELQKSYVELGIRILPNHRGQKRNSSQVGTRIDQCE